MLTLFLTILLIAFGIGCFLGLIYGFIVGFPIILNGIREVFLGAREGWRKGSSEGEQIIAARQTQPAKPEPEIKPWIAGMREAWNQGWEDVRRRQAQKQAPR